MLVRTLTVVACLAAFPSSSVAQDTRAETLERQRADKAKQLAPYKPGRLEKILLHIERNNPVELISPRNGFFVQSGYTDKPVGSGIAFGGGWRHDLFDRNARIVFEAGHSFRGYRIFRTDFFLPRLMDDRLELGIEASHRRHPQEDFYGLGSDTLEDDRTDFLFQAPGVEGRAVFAPVRWFNTGVRLGWTDVTIDSGKDKRYPNTEERFDLVTAPGLADDPSFLYTDLFAAIDTRDQRGNARDGGYYGIVWRRHNDRDLNLYSFDSVDVDLQRFFPIFDKKRVFAVRLKLISTTANDQVVPFYFQPTLGGGRSLRSARDYRFRDRNVGWTNIEYRWEAFSGLDMALFTDFGGVAPRFSDLSLFDKKAYGIGLRFNTYKAVFMRIDVAAGGDEGIRFNLKFNGPF